MLINAGNIKEALSQALPGQVSHRKMLPLNRELSAQPDELLRIKHSSVLLLLFMENNEINACLIKRPAHMKHHASQIGLPGGRIENGETALETAFRETWEEIGITSDQIEILGSLSDIYVQVSGFQIHPFVGWISEKPAFIINENEVERIIFFPLETLKNIIEQAEIETFTGLLKVPCFKFEDEIIWGATAMILSEFYDTIQQFTATNQ
jgi:8-oxo-dGTP pyrophosphatase MutT (NUDIX family)